MTGLALAGSGLSLEQSSGGGSSSNGFPIGPGSSGVVSSGGEILVLSGGLIVINAGGSETISGTETIASGGVLTIASGGSLGVAGTETISSGATLTIASGGTETIASGGNLGVAGTETISSGANLNIASGGRETISSGATLGIASGGSEVVSPGGSLVVSSGAVLSVTSGATISSGTAQTLIGAQGVAGISPLGPGGFATGRWYGCPFAGPQSTNFNATSGTLYVNLFYVPYATSFTALGTWINTSTTANLLFGAWGPITPAQMAAALSGTPLVGQTTSVAIAGTSATVSAAFTSALQPGWYAAGVMGDAAYSAGNLNASPIGAWISYIMGMATANAAGTVGSTGLLSAGATFTSGMPATLPTMTGTTAANVVGISWLK